MRIVLCLLKASDDLIIVVAGCENKNNNKIDLKLNESVYGAQYR